MARIRSISMVLLAVTLASASPAQLPDEAASIRAIIGNSRGLDEPGCAVGLLQDGKLRRFVTAGAADVGQKKPFDADTLVYSASVAKQFTALAIAQLVVAGKIGLDDDIRKFLPEMQPTPVPITVQMLIHHTSGIRDMLELGNYAGYATSRDMPRQAALKLVMAQHGTNFIPGTEWRYSNSGYLLLSEIVERVSGMSFPAYMKANVFLPAAMKRTAVLEGARTSDPDAAHGYLPDGTGFKILDTHPLFGGAGGIVFSVADLARYDHDVGIGHKVWTPAIARIMLTPGKLTSGAPAAMMGATYAGGLVLDGAWVQHSGGAEGFLNYYARLPASNRAVVVLCNRGDVKPDQIARKIIALDPSLPPLPDRKQALAGRYASPDLPVTYELGTEAGDKLPLTIHPQPGAVGSTRAVLLTKSADGSYDGAGFHLVPDNDRAGFAVGYDQRRSGVLRFRKVD
jgi:CubicO group peptidase (beta-lactamase class C family)